MSQIYLALQKFYNALKHLSRFSTESSFFDNVGDIDVFLSEYRSITLVLQKSIGGPQDPVYKKNLDILKKNNEVSEWLIQQRNNVIHEHPFALKKILRITIYNSMNATVFKQYEKTFECDESIGDYLNDIRNTFKTVNVPEVYFSVQYLYVDKEDSKERNIFDFIEKGVATMWQFLHVMKKDLYDKSEMSNYMMSEIDDMIQQMPQRWMLDALDYCYYRSTDSFERGEEYYDLLMPNVHIPVDYFVNLVKQITPTDMNFYESFIYLHSYIYVEQDHHLLSAFFLEYKDNTYQQITFSASLRTTFYRIINRIAKMVLDNDIVNVYLVTEMVKYKGVEKKELPKFLQLNYEERMPYRTATFLTFHNVTSTGEVHPIMINADELIDRLSVSTAMGRIRTTEQPQQQSIMMAQIVESFKKKMSKKDKDVD